MSRTEICAAGRSPRTSPFLPAMTVTAVVAGVLVTAEGMFLSAHDLEVVLITVTAAAVVSAAVGVLFGRRLAAAAVWADQARERERQVEKGPPGPGRLGLARPAYAGLRAMAEALEDGVVDGRFVVRLPAARS